MTAFEFVNELPPKTAQPFSARMHSGEVMETFATACRELSGRWGVWPLPLTPGQVGSYTVKIRRGELRAFPDGFDAQSRNGVLYVRYLGEGER